MPERKEINVNNQAYSQEHNLELRFMISLHRSLCKIISMELKMAEIAFVITALYL